MASTAVRTAEAGTVTLATDLAADKEMIAVDIIGDAVSWPHANHLLRALARLSVSSSKLELIAVILHIDAPNHKVTISLLDTAPINPALVKHLQRVWDLLKAISGEFPSYEHLTYQTGPSPAALTPSSPVAKLRLEVMRAVYTYSAVKILARFEQWLPLIFAFSEAATAKYTALVGLSAVIEEFAAGSTTLDDIRTGANPRWTALQAFLRTIPTAEWLLRECTVWAAELDPAEPNLGEAVLNLGILPRLRAFASVLQGRAYTIAELDRVLGALKDVRLVLGDVVAGSGPELTTRLVNTFDWIAGAWEEMRAECVVVAEDFVVADWAAWDAGITASPLLSTMRLASVDYAVEQTRPVHFPIDTAMGAFLTQHTHVTNLLKAATASGLRPLFQTTTTVVAMGEMEPMPVTKVRAEGESIAVLYVSEDAPEQTY